MLALGSPLLLLAGISIFFDPFISLTLPFSFFLLWFPPWKWFIWWGGYGTVWMYFYLRVGWINTISRLFYLFICFRFFFVPAFFIPECASGFVWRGRKGSAAHLGVCIFVLFFDFESFCSVLLWISWYMVGMSWLLWTDSFFFFFPCFDVRVAGNRYLLYFRSELKSKGCCFGW